MCRYETTHSLAVVTAT